MSVRPRIPLALLIGALVPLVGALRAGVPHAGDPGRGTPHRPAPAYAVADLGVLPGGSYSAATAVNARGQVVGYADTPLAAGRLGHEDAFRTSATGTLAARGADLGVLPGGTDSTATGINDRGQVAGTAYAANGRRHAFRLGATGTLTAPGADLGALPGYPNSVATGIDARGQVVGFAYAGVLGGFHRSRAFRTSATGTLAPGADLGTLGGATSVALATNARGQVAGVSDTRADPDHGFRTAPGGAIATAADLGGLVLDCAGDATPEAINARGQIAGTSSYMRDGGGCEAFRTSATGTPDAPGADLGALPGYPDSEARGINDRGHVVGDAYGVGRGGFRVYRAFLYDDAATPRMRDLNSLIPTGTGVTLIEADGINDAGQIAATGLVHGRTHAFRLTPVGLVRPVAAPTR